jgi:hypothetical protein
MSVGFIKQKNPKIVQVQVLEPDSEVLVQIQDSFHSMIMARNEIFYSIPGHIQKWDGPFDIDLLLLFHNIDHKNGI